MSIPPIANSFQVKWESLPASLRPPVLSCIQKVWRVVWNILSVLIPVIGLIRLVSFAMGWFARRILLPAALASQETKEFYRSRFREICEQRKLHFDIHPTTVTTPDGVSLSATLFRQRGGDANTPTAIYFQGNGAFKGMGSWNGILQESLDKNNLLNLVVFDYRSVDESTGTFKTAKDLIVDGSSIVDWVRKALKTPDDRIDFYGMSLGGAVAVKTKAADPHLSGWIVNERSFSSFEDYIRDFSKNLRWFLKPLVPLAIWALKHEELELNAAADFEKLKGKKLVVYHPRDPVIPYETSMAKKAPAHAFELKDRFLMLGANHHCTDLQCYRGANERISQFIFG